MGLTIHYCLRSPARTPTEARDLVNRLRTRALALPFAEVGELVEFKFATEIEQLDRDHPASWLVTQTRHWFGHENSRYFVSPTYLIGFVTVPGDGSEPANFGFCQFPSTILVPSATTGQKRRIKTGVSPGEWRWSSFCKTQYASIRGVANFLKCHLLVTAMLDQAKSLGILEEVNDEGGYWEDRDAEALANEVGDWNAMIAGIAGQLKDQMGDEIVAPITKFASE